MTEAHMSSSNSHDVIVDSAQLPVGELAAHFDLFDPQHSERRWEVLDYARDACPVLKTDADDGYYIITRYDDLRTVLEDATVFSSKEAGLRGVPIPMPPLTEDPPNHIEYRRALNKYLSRSYLSRYEDDSCRGAGSSS
jgi:cytochrome P450